MEAYRLYPDAALYYLTFSVIDWLPIFTSEQPCLILTESLNFCHREKHLRINAFVIMPAHIHIIAFDTDFQTQRLQTTLTALRKYTGQQLSAYCDQHLPAAFGQTLRATLRSDRQRQLWQQSKHPEAITGRDFGQTKLNYLHDNPRRKGLVLEPTQWRFSSAAYWLCTPRGHADVILSAVEW